MGTTYSIKIAESNNIEEINLLEAKIDSILNHVNQLFSTYLPDSEISKFNNSPNTLEISNEFKVLFNLSKEIYKNTKGSFDPTVNALVKVWGFGNQGKIDSLQNEILIKEIINNIGLDKILYENNQLIKLNPKIELDFSAIAKGYGVDTICKFLLNQNINNFMVEIGGEVFCNGTKFKNSWNIGLQNPFTDNKGEKIFKVIQLENNAMATSGSYRNYFEFDGKRYSHIIDPNTGFPVDHSLVSVTVIANNCANADGYATAMMILGVEDGLQIIEKDESLEAVFIIGDSEKYSIIQSSGIDRIMKH